VAFVRNGKIVDEYKNRLKKGQFQVILCDRASIREFVELHHYSKSINGVMSQYCFQLLDQEKLIGAMIYGRLGMANAWKKYSNDPDSVIELRRLCLIDETPKNSESYFIGQSLRWLKNHTNIKKIVSYADLNQGHEGIIYKATNFELLGQTSPGKIIIWNGKKYHDKAIRSTYKGELKPYAKRLKEALESGSAYYVEQMPKNIYVKTIN
jgi:hypothetical protein